MGSGQVASGVKAVRVLIAPDKFKGTMTASEAALAMAVGVRAACAERGLFVEIDRCPVADGGEGTIEAISSAVAVDEWSEGAWGPRGVFGPEFPGAQWISIDRMKTHIIESARFVGLQLVRPEDRHPLLLTSAGLGYVIMYALSESPRTIVVGLGGSATVDGGIGAAWADGRAFPTYRQGYAPIASGEKDWPGMPYAADLNALESIQPHASDPALAPLIRGGGGSRQVEFIALCDVDNPLLGPNGAAHVYGPQKGATPEDVERLEAGLENLVRVCRAAGIDADPETPGAGAAGGLGYGMMAFFGARLVSGADYVLDTVGFDERARRADLVITGEGRLDRQTARGKVAAVVARRAGAVGRATFCVAGEVEDGAERGFAGACSLASVAPSAREAKAEARWYARMAAKRVMVEWLDAQVAMRG